MMCTGLLEDYVEFDGYYLIRKFSPSIRLLSIIEAFDNTLVTRRSAGYTGLKKFEGNILFFRE
jgi:hypothetical protein